MSQGQIMSDLKNLLDYLYGVDYAYFNLNPTIFKCLHNILSINNIRINMLLDTLNNEYTSFDKTETEIIIDCVKFVKSVKEILNEIYEV